jgi:hypothetical protein
MHHYSTSLFLSRNSGRLSISAIEFCLRSVILIVASLFVTSAMAQTPGQSLTCQTNVAVTPTLRSEGFTEKTGDITLVCTGGAPIASGAQIPQINITLFYNTAVTSRLLPIDGGASNVSEALLLLDDPGAGVPSPYGTGVNFGVNAPQVLCPTPTTGCVEFARPVAVGLNSSTGIPAGTIVNVASGNPTALTTGANVFQGLVSGNQVQFFGIPFLAPVTTGVTRTIRITNVRVNASALGGGSQGNATPVVASISITGGTSLPVSNATPTVGFVQSGLSTSASAAVQRSQCSADDRVPVSVLTYSEAFPNAFKTRIAPQTNASFAGQGIPGSGLPAQNIPGAILPGESDFVMPVATGQTAGLTDFGTRLRATFNNIPAGVRLFVSTTNVLSSSVPVSPPAVIGGTATTSFARLISSETASDGDAAVSGTFPAVQSTGFAPAGGNVPIVELPVINGSATAVWEVVNTNPNGNESFQFAVYESFTPNLVQNSPSPGTATVNLSFAPAPPAFSAGNVAAASSTLVLPRFIADPNAARNIFTVGACTNAPTLTINAAAATYGAPAPVTVTLSQGSTPPTGTISVSLDGGAAVTQPVIANSASFSLTGVSAGTRVLNAAYSGDVNYSPTSQAGTLAVGKASLTVTAANASKVFGAPLPSFSSSFSGFANNDGPGVIGGAPSFTTTATSGSAVGTYPITPAAGTLSSSNYTFVFANGTLSITKANTSTALAGGNIATVTATPPGAGTPTGTVQFFSGSSLLASVTLSGSTAVLSGSSGLATTAVYIGDANFNGSTSPVLAVAPPTSAMALSSSPNPSTLGQSVTFTASVTTDNGRPSGPVVGTVQFFDAGKSLGTATLNGGGQASVSTTALTGGSHAISATYSGDAIYPPAQANMTHTVTAVPPVTVTVAPATPGFGQPAVFTVQVIPATIPSGFSGPTGTVDLLESGFTLGSGTLSSGVASITLSNLSVGVHNLVALYRGDGIWLRAFSTIAVTVSQGDSASSLAASLESAGQVRLTATVTSVAASTALPSGSVRFVDTSDGSVLATQPLTSGTAHIIVPLESVARPIAAIYSGDDTFKPSTSARLPVIANAAGLPASSFAPDEAATAFYVSGLSGDIVSKLPLSASLGGVTLTVTDSSGMERAALVYATFASTGQINFVLPADSAMGGALLTVRLPDGSKLTVPLMVTSTAPGVFTANMDGKGIYAGQVVYVHPDGSQTIDNSASLDSARNVYVPKPIDFRGSGDRVYLVLYGTGIRHALSLTATVNGISVPAVHAAQPEYAGLDQINLEIPRSLAGAGQVTIVITVDGRASNAVTAVM